MAVVNRGTVEKPTLPKRTVEVPALDGEVVVRGLLLDERLLFQQRVRADRDDEGGVRRHVPDLLALAVTDDEGEPLFTVDEWRVFGAKHQSQALELFSVAMEVSGFVGEDERKN